jgi:tetratricopeptide (TPR) repeat protein
MVTHAGDPPSGPQEAGLRLYARDSERVYQAAGNQYIFEQRRPTPAAVCNTLPRDTATFTGRHHEIATLLAAIADAEQAAESLAVHAIDGMPGVGKTALAVHVGHRAQASFPDGCWFVDLHAHAVGHGPVEPADALAALLLTDGVHPDQIPADVDARAAVWRARMAGRRTLLILDDAAGYRQVESLLPGAGSCLVLITSRRRLTGLGARQGAAMLSLGTLPPDQASTLFGRLAGRRLTGAESLAVDRLTRLCGYLPLAIALLAAKFRPEPLWRVTDLVAELAVRRDRLTQLQAEDVAVAAAFDLSYRGLPAARRRFFRRLGLHPGVDVEAHAAAALDDIRLAESRQHLEALYDHHLIDQPTRGRFRMHDLVTDFARRLAGEDAAADRDRAVARVLDYYRDTAARADRHLASAPGATAMRLAPTSVPELAGAEAAMGWFRTEIPNLLACMAHAKRHGDHARVVGIAAALAEYLRRTGPWSRAVELHHAAVVAASHLADRAGHARALRDLGGQYRRTGDYPAAGRALRGALETYRELGDRPGTADVLTELGTMYRQTWDLAESDLALAEAIAIYQDLGDTHGQADVLTSLGISRYLTSDYPGAEEALRRALASYGDLGDRLGQANALFRLGVLRRAMDDYPGAMRVAEEALAIYQELGAASGQANAQHSLGVVRRMTGDGPGAAVALNAALAGYQELGDRLGQANAETQLGAVRRAAGDFDGAVDHLRQARAGYEEIGDRLGQATVLEHLGATWRLSGDFAEAATALRQANTIYQELGQRLGQASALNQSAALRFDRGEIPEALDRYRRALDLAVEVHSLLEQARAIEGAARCAMRLGDTAGPVDRLRQAMAIYERIGTPDAPRIAAEIAGANATANRQL